MVSYLCDANSVTAWPRAEAAHRKYTYIARHRSLAERGRRKACVRDKGLAHTQKGEKEKKGKKTFRKSEEKDSNFQQSY